jgi:hypothetical protein
MSQAPQSVKVLTAGVEQTQEAVNVHLIYHLGKLSQSPMLNQKSNCLIRSAIQRTAEGERHPNGASSGPPAQPSAETSAGSGAHGAALRWEADGFDSLEHLLIGRLNTGYDQEAHHVHMACTQCRQKTLSGSQAVTHQQSNTGDMSSSRSHPVRFRQRYGTHEHTLLQQLG